MKIQGETTVYVSRSGFVEGTITVHIDDDKVLLTLGGGLSVSLPLGYARVLADDILEALAADTQRKQDADTAEHVHCSRSCEKDDRR